MSERLRHLQRQRALLSEHLAWIDSEIASETTATSNAAPRAPAPAESIASPLSPAAIVPLEADALIEKYAAHERQNPDDLRRGCLYVFASAVLLFAAGVTAVWLLFYR